MFLILVAFRLPRPQRCGRNKKSVDSLTHTRLRGCSLLFPLPALRRRTSRALLFPTEGVESGTPRRHTITEL